MKSGGILTFYSGLRGISPFFFYYYMSFCVCLSVSIIAPTMILDSIEKFWLTVSSIFPFVQFWADFRNSTEITLYSLCIWTFLGLFFYLFSVNAFFWSVCLSELNRTHNDIRLWVKLWKKIIFNSNFTVFCWVSEVRLKFDCILTFYSGFRRISPFFSVIIFFVTRLFICEPNASHNDIRRSVKQWNSTEIWLYFYILQSFDCNFTSSILFSLFYSETQREAVKFFWIEIRLKSTEIQLKFDCILKSHDPILMIVFQ